MEEDTVSLLVVIHHPFRLAGAAFLPVVVDVPIQHRLSPPLAPQQQHLGQAVPLIVRRGMQRVAIKVRPLTANTKRSKLQSLFSQAVLLSFCQTEPSGRKRFTGLIIPGRSWLGMFTMTVGIHIFGCG